LKKIVCGISKISFFYQYGVGGCHAYENCLFFGNRCVKPTLSRGNFARIIALKRVFSPGISLWCARVKRRLIKNIKNKQ
jgi:hypothetical protein